MWQRCQGTGQQIETKMMKRNGFTKSEANALIGAHTIGLVRNTFGSGLANPWVPNGADDFDPAGKGPVFDNAYHDFMINSITSGDNYTAFDEDFSPFTRKFKDWFIDDVNKLDYLDTDLALVFTPATAGAYPNYREDSETFAASNAAFLGAFDAAYDKMSKLGVSVALTGTADCAAECAITIDAALTEKQVEDLFQINADADAIDQECTDDPDCTPI